MVMELRRKVYDELLEWKSTADGRSSAMVVHSKDLRIDGPVTYVPIYMMQFIDL
jgi:hypothetical protein